jgi:drug/metabolite transporter (DMT)-like permease
VPQPVITAATPQQARPLRGIGFKVASVGVFLTMATLLKAAEGIPAGEMVFFRSLFAVIPVVIFLAWRRELIEGLKTKRPLGHVWRGVSGALGQGLGFYALTQLPLAEATAINYALPLMTVIAGALFLGEKVRLYRWSAVIVGLVGVGIIVAPRLGVFSGEASLGPGATYGAIAALASCVVATVAFMQIRRLVRTERSSTIVIYYSLVCAGLALVVTAPLGWVMPSPGHATMLIAAGICGGIGQILLTESFRNAEMSVVAPFEYISLVFALVVGFVVFGDVPTAPMIAGSVIVIAAGIFIIVRERQLGLARARAAAEIETPPSER